jgi:hypothetical protein
MASCVSTVLQQRSDGWGFYLGDYKVTLMRPHRFLDSLHTYIHQPASPSHPTLNSYLPCLLATPPAPREVSSCMYIAAAQRYCTCAILRSTADSRFLYVVQYCTVHGYSAGTWTWSSKSCTHPGKFTNAEDLNIIDTTIPRTPPEQTHSGRARGVGWMLCNVIFLFPLPRCYSTDFTKRTVTTALESWPVRRSTLVEAISRRRAPWTGLPADVISIVRPD